MESINSRPGKRMVEYERNVWREELERRMWEITAFKKNSEKLRADLELSLSAEKESKEELLRAHETIRKLTEEVQAQKGDSTRLEQELEACRRSLAVSEEGRRGAEAERMVAETTRKASNAVYWELALSNAR
eukprot:CAMPEP_0184366030 /NCGR_PEP_ID=MMETSP1089-20130417/151666_1 /TAXON_ID=38269 ORGANISM="Gloeochaete wittrockiana, Strain SAG46.84" /NCGR_SAMPLE_ID=MMETSP1089 /ASSEMBLY_ACC=CAM_ASM_000445 /LENGTH=131 /DNA_ID=CAMNT_0026707463 /DNA_START=93 /DNA_END=485 /DNA_ORIENTATION=+